MWLRRGALLFVAGVLAVSCSNDDGDDVIDLGADAVGECLNFEENPAPVVESLPVVPCNEPHTQEIFFLPEVTDQPVYPGLDTLEEIAQVRCLGAFEDYVGTSPFESDLFVSWLVPTLNTWENDNDRQIICVIGEGNDAPLPPGSVRNANR